MERWISKVSEGDGKRAVKPVHICIGHDTVTCIIKFHISRKNLCIVATLFEKEPVFQPFVAEICQ